MKVDAVSKANLSPAWQKLVELMSRMCWGSIEALTVRDGEPCFEPPPRVTRELRMKPAEPRRPPPENFELRDQVLELVRHLRAIDRGIVQRLEVQNGLPYRIVIEVLDD